VLFAALAVVLAGCGQPSPTDAVADLEALFPTLAQYRVTNLYRTDECEYIVYARGAFVTDPGSPDCEIDVEGPQPRSAIDAQARTDLDAIYAASERYGARLQAAFPEYRPDGSIEGGSFGFHWCTSFIYEPGWTELPAGDSEVSRAVDADWYSISGVTC
jgi:hypothetical protein